MFHFTTHILFVVRITKLWMAQGSAPGPPYISMHVLLPCLFPMGVHVMLKQTIVFMPPRTWILSSWFREEKHSRDKNPGGARLGKSGSGRVDRGRSQEAPGWALSQTPAIASNMRLLSLTMGPIFWLGQRWQKKEGRKVSCVSCFRDNKV